MILTLHTETTIDSAHKLEGYKGICSSLHGHTWKLRLWFVGSSKYLDEVGILVDFGIVKSLKKELDHKYLNDVIKKNPTAENLCMWIHDWLDGRLNFSQGVRKDRIDIMVRIYETAVDKLTYCEVET